MYKLTGKSKIFLNAEFTRTLDMLVNLVDEWERDPDSVVFLRGMDGESVYKSIFKKYQFYRLQFNQ